MHKIVEQFNTEIKKYEDFMIKAEVLIKELIVQKGISFHKIESRVKDASKLEEKISRKNDKYSDICEITDIVGIRVITYFEDDVDKVASIIEDEFIKDKQNSIDKRNLESDRFGYKSLHYVVGLNSHRKKLTEYSRFKDLKIEIQIRSVLQHAWAEIEHDIGYKGEKSIPTELRRNFYRVAALLETADIEFVKIKEQLKVYERNVEKEIQTNPSEVEVNSASLKSYILSSELVHQLDQEVALALNTKLESSKSKTINLDVAKFYFVEIQSIKNLDNKLNQKKKYIPIYAKNWGEDEKAPILSNGVSVFYLCYFLVGEKRDPNFAKQYVDECIFTGKHVLDDKIIDRYAQKIVSAMEGINI